MSIAFSPDSMRLACCGHIKGRRPFVSILPTDEGSRLAVLEGRELDEDDPVSQLVCSWLPDRLIFVCRTRSAVSVCIWEAHTLELRFSWEDTTPVDCDSVLLSRDGQRLAVAAICDPWEASVRSYQGPRATNVPLCVLWDLTTGGSREVLIARSSQDQVLAATFDPEGERLVLSFADHTIRIWDVETRETLLSVSEPVPVKFEPHYHLYTSLSSEIPSSKAVTFSPDGRYLLSLRYMSIDDHRETLVILWDSRSGRPLLRLEDTQPSARGYGNAGLVLFNPSGTYIAFTANDGMVQIFDLYRGLPVRTHWRPENVSTQFGQCSSYSASRDGPASSLAISSNGQTLCWGTWRGEVEIHSLD